MYITLNNFSPVIISCLVYMLYDDKLYMLKSINKVSVLFCSVLIIVQHFVFHALCMSLQSYYTTKINNYTK